MKIAPAILGRHLQDAAIEQLSLDLSGKGYDVQREVRVEGAPPSYRADLIARRGDETIVYEVKVLGDRSHADLTRLAQAARDMGAQFRLVVVRPQRQVGIEIDKASELVFKALQEAEPSPLAPILAHLGEGWRAVHITDVELDTVAWRGEDIEVSGAAVVKLDNLDKGGLLLALPLTFTLRFDAAWRFTRQPSIAIDTSDLDI